MPPRIFISYRRSDSAGDAGRIYDRLAQEFGAQNIFRDVETMDFGVDLVQTLNETVAKCDVLIAVIGPKWLDERDHAGKRRLDDPKDFVRNEIAIALERGIRVIPIFIESTPVPTADQLPHDLAALSNRTGLHLHNDSFDGNIRALIEKLRTVHATQRPGPAPASLRDFSYPLAALGLAALFLICSETGILPPQDVLLEKLRALLVSGSAAWLFAISAIESTVAFNVYFPGALVILAAMAATANDPGLTLLAFACITSGQLVGYAADYCIGYFFERTLVAPNRSLHFESRYVKIDWPIPPWLLIFATFFHPHSAALTSYNLGTQAFSKWRFAVTAFSAVMFWGAVWTIVCITQLNFVIKQTPWGRVFVVYVLIWIGWIAFRYFRQRKQ
jgi:membrane protein DedA with SNARE-associated domain